MNLKDKLLADTLLNEIQRIGDIHKDGIVVTCDEYAIRDVMKIDAFDIDELRGLRNLLVEVLADRIEYIRYKEEQDFIDRSEKRFDEYEEQNALMIVVTGIIDKNMMSLYRARERGE